MTNRTKAMLQRRVSPKFVLTEAMINILKKNPTQTKNLINRLKKAKGGKVKK